MEDRREVLLDSVSMESAMLSYVDEIKALLSPETWGNALLECSKNEVLVLFYLYQREEANMTQLAEYIGVPLNTATGIIARMEKKEMVLRQRSREDKRVVTISMTTEGRQQVKEILSEFVYYGQKLTEDLTNGELKLLGQILGKVLRIVKKGHQEEAVVSGKKVRKIVIE